MRKINIPYPLVGIVALCFGLWLLPVLLGYAPPFGNHAIRSLAVFEYMGRTGNIWSNDVAYLAWFGGFLPVGLLEMAFHINLEPIVNYAPFIWHLLYLIPLYYLLRNILGKGRGIWIGMAIFLVANWTGEAYFGSTMSAGLLLILILYALITSPKMFEQGKTKWLMLAGVVITYGYLAITHLLASLVALCGIVGWFLWHRRKRTFVVLGICVLLLVAWNLTGALSNSMWVWDDFKLNIGGDEVAECNVPTALDVYDGVVDDGNGNVVLEIPQRTTEAKGRGLILNPSVILSSQIFTHIAGSGGHIVVGWVRFGYSLLWVVLGGCGAFIAVKDTNRRKTAILMLLIGLAPLVMVFIPYGGRILHRLYLVSLIPLAYFGAVLFDGRRKLAVWGLGALLLISVPLFLVSNYGNHEFDEITPQHMEGLHYFADNLDGGYIISFDFYWILSDFEKYHYIPLDEVEIDGNMFLPPKYHRDKPCYAIITRQERVLCDYIYDAPEFMGWLEELLDDAPNCSLIYDNPDFEIYEVATQ